MSDRIPLFVDAPDDWNPPGFKLFVGQEPAEVNVPADTFDWLDRLHIQIRAWADVGLEVWEDRGDLHLRRWGMGPRPDTEVRHA